MRKGSQIRTFQASSQGRSWVGRLPASQQVTSPAKQHDRSHAPLKRTILINPMVKTVFIDVIRHIKTHFKKWLPKYSWSSFEYCNWQMILLQWNCDQHRQAVKNKNALENLRILLTFLKKYHPTVSVKGRNFTSSNPSKKIHTFTPLKSLLVSCKQAPCRCLRLQQRYRVSTTRNRKLHSRERAHTKVTTI